MAKEKQQGSRSLVAAEYRMDRIFKQESETVIQS